MSGDEDLDKLNLELDIFRSNINELKKAIDVKPKSAAGPRKPTVKSLLPQRALGDPLVRHVDRAPYQLNYYSSTSLVGGARRQSAVPMQVVSEVTSHLEARKAAEREGTIVDTAASSFLPPQAREAIDIRVSYRESLSGIPVEVSNSL